MVIASNALSLTADDRYASASKALSMSDLGPDTSEWNGARGLRGPAGKVLPGCVSTPIHPRRSIAHRITTGSPSIGMMNRAYNERSPSTPTGPATVPHTEWTSCALGCLHASQHAPRGTELKYNTATPCVTSAHRAVASAYLSLCWSPGCHQA